MSPGALYAAAGLDSSQAPLELRFHLRTANIRHVSELRRDAKLRSRLTCWPAARVVGAAAGAFARGSVVGEL